MSQDLVEVGAKLNIAYVLEGSIRSQDDKMRVTAQLFRSKDGFHVWSKTSERAPSTEFEMQSSLVNNIATLLETNVLFDQVETLAAGPLGVLAELVVGYNRNAMLHLIKSNRLLLLSIYGKTDDFEDALNRVKIAVEIDPRFQLAQAQLLSLYLSRFDRSVPLIELSREAHKVAEKALALDPNDQYLRFLQGGLYATLDLNFAKAEKTYSLLDE
ncbi:MAG: tetratricopeptide (TPR) repeat protein [Granulosicoccus sp.]|jgi:tetratricopeptide (TPR) repeat protein